MAENDKRPEKLPATQARSSPTRPVDPFDYVAKPLEDLLKQPHVISYTLYIRDPITGDLRLHRAQGIKHPETIVGFILTGDQEERRRKLAAESGESKQDSYFERAHEATLVGRDPLPDAIRQRIRRIADSRGPENGGNLYRSFVERERIVSCFRIEHLKKMAGKTYTAILFVNFDAKVDDRDPALMEALDNASDALDHQLSEISESLDSDYPTALRRAVRILQSIQHLVANRESTLASQFFDRLLKSVMGAMDIGPNEGFGTIHLFRPSSADGRLELCACTQHFVESGDTTFSAFEGRGVVSWVALHRKPVLINQMSASDFRFLRIPHPEFGEIQSELAVPMIVGDEVIGVLNVERRTANRFTPQDAHTLLYAAAEAAVAYEFYNNMQRAKESERRAGELLATTNRAANLGTRDDALLNELAELLARWIDVAFVEIWEFDEAANSFSYAGANYAHFKRDILPRQNGASHFIVKHQQPVWMSEIQEDGSYVPQYWDSKDNCWIASEPHLLDGSTLPERVNSVVVAERTTGELGIPIMAKGRCVGVSWFKYNIADVAGPSAEKMALIMKLVGHVAIVVDSMRRLALREDNDLRDRVVKNFFAVGRQQIPGMQGHVLYEQCHSKVGGDFCVFLPNSQQGSWACLLGDVAGHGYAAALDMMPLITAFRIFHRKSESPSYVLQQLADVNDEGIMATALCFAYFEREIFEGNERQGVQRFVKACSAGHMPLIVIHKNGQPSDVEELPKRNGPAETQLLGAERFMSFGEECIEVQPGDLLIGYTDGVNEARVTNTDLFGIRRIKAIAIEKQDESPEAIANAIFHAAKAHSQGQMADDVTIVVVRICDDLEYVSTKSN
jgi:serine phosphatase RsbU (regulator of sigma subunit)